MNNRNTGLAAGVKRKLASTGSAIALLLTAAISHAAVVVSLTDNDGVPNVGSGDAGQPFTIIVTLSSTLEQTTGLTYFLQDPSASIGNAHFQIIGRNVAGSPFSDLTTSDGVVTGAASAMLDPSNNHDLGAGLADINSPLGIGSFFVANITLLVLPTTPNGNYTIELTPNSVAAGPGPNFPEIQIQRFSYTVVTPSVPEPAAASLLILGGLFLGTRTRFRKTTVALG